MEKPKTMQELFELFTNENDVKPFIHSPFIQGNYVIATDGEVLIRCKKNKYQGDYSSDEAPNITEILPESNLNKPIDYNLQDFTSLFDTDEQIRIDCKECDGFGDVDWQYKHYEQRFECPVCEGRGGRDVKTGAKVFSRKYGVKLNGEYFKIDNIYKLIQVAEYTEKPIILTSIEKHKHLFQVGDFDVLILPTLVDSDYFNKIINLNL